MPLTNDSGAFVQTIFIMSCLKLESAMKEGAVKGLRLHLGVLLLCVLLYPHCMSIKF